MILSTPRLKDGWYSADCVNQARHWGAEVSRINGRPVLGCYRTGPRLIVDHGTGRLHAYRMSTGIHVTWLEASVYCSKVNPGWKPASQKRYGPNVNGLRRRINRLLRFIFG